MTTRERIRYTATIVIIVGLGIGIFGVVRFFGSYTSFSGWTGYAPLTSQGPLVPRFSPILQLLVWVIGTTLWVVSSLIVLRFADRTRPASSSNDTSPPPSSQN